MIITDPNRRPSERFIETLKKYFEVQGYVLQKNSRKFIRPNDLGFEAVYLRFRIGTLVSASLQWSRSFLALEKIYAEISGNPRKYKSEISIGTDLLNSSHRHKDQAPFDIPLFTPSTLTYDDLNLNEAGELIIKLYEKYAAPFLEMYNSYSSIERELNILPIGNTDLTPVYSKRVAYGIILAKYCDAPNYDEIISSYNQYAAKMHHLTRDEIFELIFKTTEYVEKRDVKQLLSRQT